MADNPDHIEQLKAEIRSQMALLVKCHQFTKKLLLLSEQLGPDGKNFFQVIREHRDAYEHIMRASGAELNEECTEENLRYILSNVKAALGHEVRAFYDIADLMMLITKEGIADIIGSFRREAIQQALPQYVEEWRPKILEYDIIVADIRGGKDIGSIEIDDGGDIEKYYNIIIDMVDTWLQINQEYSAVSARLEATSEAMSLLNGAANEIRNKYSKNVVTEAIPDYFSKVLPELEKKAKAGNVEGVKEGIEQISDLTRSLDDLRHMERKKVVTDGKYNRRTIIFAAILSAVATLLAVFATSWLQKTPEKNGKAQDASSSEIVQ